MTKFDNLKIRFFFDSPVIIDRYTTIDSILIAQHFNNIMQAGQLKEFVMPTPDNIDFIDAKHGVFSGSIWYIDKSEIPIFKTQTITKTVNVKKYLKYTPGPDNINLGSGEFKAYMLNYETIFVESIYFYIRGNREKITELCSQVKNIGRKRHIGYGAVSGFEVKPAEDRSFMLTLNNPSKPLPVSSFPKASTGKIALYRPRPPYYLKTDKAPCYMPTSSLYERTSHFKAKQKPILVKNISSSKLACEAGSIKPDELPENPHHCAMCGTFAKHTVPISVLFRSKNFNDYPDIRGNYICKWCLAAKTAHGIRTFSGKCITETDIIPLSNKDKIKQYIKANKLDATPENFKDIFVRTLANQEIKPPYVITLKTMKNNEHIIWKATVGISTGIIPVQSGKETLYVDTELLKEAIEQTDTGTAPYLYLNNTEKRNHLPEEERRFFAKYDRAVLKMLSYIRRPEKKEEQKNAKKRRLKKTA